MANADDVSDKTGKAKEKRWSGKYCCLPQCTKSNGTGHQLYQVPSGKNRRLGLDTAEWANEFHKVIFKYRYDAIFSKQVKAGKKFICNIHFEKSDIQVSSHKSWLKHGVVPTKNLPEKLFATPAPSTRRKIEKHPLPEKNKTFQYANIENIVKAFNSIVLKKWRYHKIDSKKLHFLLFRDPIVHACPAISLLISQKEDSSYELSCAFGGAYTNHISEQLSLQNMGISAILRHLASFVICDGYSEVADQSEWIRRTLYEATPAGVIKQERLFSTECEVTTTNKTASSVCNACMRLHVRQENSERRRASRLEKVRDIPLSKHCVLQNASKERLEASLALNRKRYRERSVVFELARRTAAGICERHFQKSDFVFMKRTTKIIPGRMPSLNLPVRRSARIRLKRDDKPDLRTRTGVECSAYGCNKRRKAHSKKEHIRSDSEGSEDEETKEKRKHPRTFHPFPSDPVLLKKWLMNIRRKSWIPTSKSIICCDHFKEEDIVRSGYTAGRLRDGALPTRFKAFKKHLKGDDDDDKHHGEPLCDHSIFGVTSLEQHSIEDGEAFSVPCSLVGTTLLSMKDGGKTQQDIKMRKQVAATC